MKILLDQSKYIICHFCLLLLFFLLVLFSLYISHHLFLSEKISGLVSCSQTAQSFQNQNEVHALLFDVALRPLSCCWGYFSDGRGQTIEGAIFVQFFLFLISVWLHFHCNSNPVIHFHFLRWNWLLMWFSVWRRKYHLGHSHMWLIFGWLEKKFDTYLKAHK